MNKIMFGCAAAMAVALAGPQALAADLQGKAPVYKAAPAPRTSWTGCYVGGNVGGVWSHADHTWTQTDGVPEVGTPTVGTTLGGFAYGGQIGCDYQFDNSWVVGIRGMWDGTNLKSSDVSPLPNVGNFPQQYFTTKIRSFETVTARLGFLVNPTVMVYAVGGAAWLQGNFTVGNPASGPFPGDFLSIDTNRTGYDVGAGLAWMFAPNWDVWVEYDHLGFGTKTLASYAPLFLSTLGFDEKISIDKVLVGVDYRFNFGR